VEQKIDFNVDRSLEAIIKNLKVFTQLGDWSGVLKLSTKVPHSKASFLAVDFSKLSEHAIKSLLQLQLQQTRRPVKVAGAPGVLLDLVKPLNLNADLALIQQKPLVKLQLQMSALNALVYKVRDLNLDLNLAAQEQDDFKLNLAAKIKEVFLPELGQALSFALDNEVVFKENLSQIDLTSNAELNAQKLLKLHLNFNDAPKQADIRSQLEMQISPQLIASIKKINPLDLLGGIKLSKDMNVKIVHQSDSLKSLGPDPLAQIGLASNMRLVLAQTAVPKKSSPQRLIIEKPLELVHEAKLNNNKMNSHLLLNLAKLEFVPLIAVDKVEIDLKTRSNDMTTLALVDNELAVNVAQVHLLNPPTPAQEKQEKQPPKIDISQFIKNIQLAVKLALVNKQRINLDHLALKVDELLRLGAKGWLAAESQSGQISGFVDVVPPKNLSPIMKGKASGSIKIPWNLAIDNGKRFELDGQVTFKEFTIVASDPVLKVEGFSGSIPFSEEIQLENDQSLKFVYLVQQNPFERVDFQRQEPLLSSAPLYFRNIEAAGQQLGPFRGNIELEQNMLKINKFDLDLLQGSVSGELMLDLLPQQLSVRLLSRITNIKPKLLGNVPSAEKLAPISLRTAIVYDVNRALIDGRVDVDKIGGDQLISLINVLDPEYQDDQLNSARSALNLAYPTYVGINMQQGLMDMDIDLSLAGVQKSIQVRKIPLYSFVAAATGDLMQTLKGVPIQ
ncbi:MAG: hypothetical protein KBD78_16715, partial [Oligoflexales bacterium]|nr:hypothetical protein [Oligoflexales bacterium]